MTWNEIVKQGYEQFMKRHNDIEYVTRCKDCIHRPYVVPAKYNSRGQCEKYSYIESIDEICPYICDDAWYNRVPEDNFFCAYGEQKGDSNV